MPIYISTPISVIDQEAFHAIDKVVTGFAFSVHNEFGRYLDERLYQNELADRLAQRFRVLRELKKSVRLGAFSKEYHADFLLDDGVIVETKAAEALTNAHKAQVLNYPIRINADFDFADSPTRTRPKCSTTCICAAFIMARCSTCVRKRWNTSSSPRA